MRKCLKKIFILGCLIMNLLFMTACDKKKEEDNGNEKVIEFSDFLVERCVRKTLGKDWDEEITYADVKKVKELDICNTYDPTFSFGEWMNTGYSGYIDLTDLRYLENLEVLRVDAYVGYDTIVNVDAIANCKKLKELVIPCANTYQSETINLVGYKYWSDIFSELPQLEKVDLGMYVDDDMKEVMLSKTSNHEIEFAKGEKYYGFKDEIEYYFYKVGNLKNLHYSWYVVDAEKYIQEWDYDYDSLSSSMDKNKNTYSQEGNMFPAIKASSENDLEQQLSKLDENIEDLIIVAGNYEFNFELLERFDKLVTLTVINDDSYLDSEAILNAETSLMDVTFRGYVGVIPQNGEALSKLDNLQVLNLSGFVGDLSFIADCNYIKELSLVRCALDDANFIGKLKNIRELNIKIYDSDYDYEKWTEQVYTEINQLTNLKYLKDMNGLGHGLYQGEECDGKCEYAICYKNINDMKSLETLWLKSEDNKCVISNIVQSKTIKNLSIQGADLYNFNYEFNKMICLENFCVLGMVEKINVQSLIGLDNMKSICYSPYILAPEEFQEFYTIELAKEVTENKKISAFLMPIHKEFRYEFDEIYDREISKILYDMDIKESAYSDYKWNYIIDEDLTIDEYVMGKE